MTRVSPLRAFAVHPINDWWGLRFSRPALDAGAGKGEARPETNKSPTEMRFRSMMMSLVTEPDSELGGGFGTWSASNTLRILLYIMDGRTRPRAHSMS